MEQLSKPISTLSARLGLGGRIIRNTSYLFFANTTAKILALFLNTLIIWSLGDESFGTYRWVVAYCGLFANLMELGMTRVGVRAVARAPEQARPIYRGLVKTKLFLSLISATSLVLVTEIFLRGEDDFPIMRAAAYIWIGVVLIHVMRRNHEAVFMGLQRMGYQALFVVSNRFITLSLAYIFLQFYTDLLALFLLFVAIDMTDLLFQGVALRRLLRKCDNGEIDTVEGQQGDEERDHKKRSIWSWLRESLPLGLQEVSSEVYMQIDSVMIGFFIGQLAVGTYNKAYLILTAVLVLPQAINQAIMPALAALHKRAPDQMVHYFRRNYLMMVALGPLVLTGLLFFAPLFLMILKGNSLVILRIYSVLMMSLPVFFLVMPMAYLLVATFRQKVVTTVSVSMALFNVVANAIFIPKYGIIGAAWATLGTEILALVAYAIYLQHTQPGLFDSRGLVRLAGFHALWMIAACYTWGSGWPLQLAFLTAYSLATGGIVAALRWRNKREDELAESLAIREG